jgi:hypothetical protein
MLRRVTIRAGAATSLAGLAAIALMPVGPPPASASTVAYAYVTNPDSSRWTSSTPPSVG